MATTAYQSSYTGAQIDAAIGAVANKQDTLVSGTNIKTINNQSILGSGNISISSGGDNYIAMTATWDADDYLENFAFDDASAAYTIYNANGANTILGIETGIMDGNTFVSDDFYYYAQVDQENAGAQQYFFFEFWDNTDKYKVTIQVNESTLSVNTYSHQDFLGGGGEANVIESISVNNVAQTVTNKNVNLQFKTINNESISGTGNISVSGGSSYIVEMTASWDANDEYLENFTFSNPSSDYTKFTEHGSEVIVIVSTGVMENSTFIPDDYYYYTNIVWDNNSSSWGITFWDNNEKYSITVNSQNQTLVVNNERHETVGGGEENVIETVKVNGSALTPDANKAVDVTVPTETTVSGWGFTKNAGTITGITMNGASKGTSGVVNLGTVITSETALSKGTTTGSGNAVTDLSVSGHTITLTKGKTFLESESDPIFAASAAYGISSSDITNWNGKTSNVGTITGITMNNVSKGTSGVVDLGTVITSETTLSKGTTTGSGNAVTDLSVSGHTITLTKGTTFLTSSDTIKIYSGTSAPSSSTGSNGDIYIQTS